MEAQAPNTFAQFLDCLDSVAVIIASVVAIWGINTWKREHVGRRRIDLAEETLALFYEARDVINATRSAIGQAGDTELVEEWASYNETDASSGGPAPPPLLALRLSRRQRDLFSRIRAVRFRFAAAFGRDAAQPFYDLLAVRRDICDAEDEFRLVHDNVNEVTEDHKRRMTELIRVMYTGSNDSDPTTRRLNEIVEGVERVCRPVIESYGRTVTTAMLSRGRKELRNLHSRRWFIRLRVALTRIWDRGSHPGGP